MKTRPLAALAALLFVLPAFAQTASQPASAATEHDQRIPQIIHSLQQVRGIRQTQISTDGNQIAWAVRNEGIYIAPVSEPSAVRHVTACAAGVRPSEGSLAWSPDSTTLAFFSNCGKDGQPHGENRMNIYTVAASGSAAPHLLAKLNGYAESLRYSPNGKLLSFLYIEGATRPSGALAPEPPPAGVIGVEQVEHRRIAAVDSSSGQLAEITPASLYVYEYSWSADSNHLAYTAAPPPGQANWWTAKLYTQDADFNAKPKVVFDPSGPSSTGPGRRGGNTTTGPLHGLQIAVPRFSQDGSRIAFIGGLMSDQGVTGGDIYIMPSSGSQHPVNLTASRHETADWLTWAGPEEIDYSAIASGISQFRSLNLESPSSTAVRGNGVRFQFPATIGGGGLLMSLSYERGQFAFIKSSFAEPPEVWYARDVGAECNPPADQPNLCYEFRQITHLNDSLKPAWGKAEPVSWTNEGFHIDGWLLYPANYDPAKKYPLIVYVHGGPAYANLARWPGAGFGPAPFSALGYFVLMPNPRGSYGEGEKFTQANRKDFGYGDLRDILAGVDAVSKTNPIDPNRVGLTGWSYGGFMTMFAITQTHRFKAAVAGAGISDWKSYYGENSIDQWMIPFFGASVYDDPAVYAKSGAINFIKNAKTPTLMVVGDRDGECPMPQSYEMWHALRYYHVPTELVVYPDEGHGFHKESDRINVLERALAWFNQYMP